jgi:hypothetical protein
MMPAGLQDSNAVFWDVVLCSFCEQKLHGTTSQKMAFFIVTTVET